jgi:LacI family transcriptional regulator
MGNLAQRIQWKVSTYKDIQRRTGLSLSTISKYFNGKSVLDANRAAIEEAVGALGYRVNTVASNLRRGKSRTVGVLLPSLENHFHMSIVARAERLLRRCNVGVIVSSTEDEAPDSRAVDSLISRMVDVLVTVPAHGVIAALDDAAAARIPVICVDWDPGRPEFDLVAIDNQAAGGDATRHLLDHGHRRIGLIGGPRSITTAAARMQGYRAELRHFGVALDRTLVTTGPLTVEHGRTATQALLGREQRPSAIFAVNAELTIGALIAVNESGLRLGRDISFVGFDNPDVAQVTQPRLTVVAQPIEDLAAAVAGLVLQRLEHPAGATQRLQFSATLALGHSVADLSAGAARRPH